MMLRTSKIISLICILAAFLTTPGVAQSTLQSPAQYLGYELGSHFTPHYKVLGYFKQVAKNSPMVSYEKYGATNEGRELGIVKVSTEARQSKLEQIRTDNLKRAGFMEGDIQGEDIPIVWLSYNVHGNEASSSEAAMKTLYELVRPDRSDTKQWLQNTVVIMDPMINPDGRDRYVHWYNETVGDTMNAHAEAREHHEPWPGGRTNHYYFDLNRDWAWLTQKESRARVALYQKWMPEIHVDYHEQGVNSPYYFAPAAEPFHKAITDWQRQFQFTIGKNHAKYFDQNSWLYFTREEFDLFYPSYGDTYPIFNGAIGMTYEQGGGGGAGLGIIKAEGDTLTLKDRLMHHHTTGLSTVEVASMHADELINKFQEYFKTARENPAGTYKSYIIKNDSSANIAALLHLMDEQNIRYGRLNDSHRYNGFSYATNKNEDVSAHKNDIVISAYQPKSVLVRALFAPKPELSDSLTYDITAWALPYAYGLDAYAVKDKVGGATTFTEQSQTVHNTISGKPYAYLTDWNDLSDAQFLADLLKKGIIARVSDEPFTLQGKDYDAGTLVITRNGNTNMGDNFDQIVQQAADRHHQQLQAASTGFVSSGADFGSSNVALVKAPRVALLSGAGTSSGNVGEVWHFFDKQINYPITLIDTDYFGRANLSDFDVLILPSGYYRDVLNDTRLKDIQQWVRAGGRLIVIERANRLLAGKKGFDLKLKSTSKSEKSKEDSTDLLRNYSERQRDRAPDSNPGSIFKIDLDNTHPLAFGYGKSYFSLKLDSDAYSYLDNGWNVGVAKDDAYQSGFIGYRAKKKMKNTLAFGVQDMGRGHIVYMLDNPLFRAFWYNGKLLFSNAVFMVGN